MGHHEPEFARSKANLVPFLGARPTRETVVSVLECLPGDVIDFAISKCFFVSVGTDLSEPTVAFAQTVLVQRYCIEDGRDWVIVLCDQAAKPKTKIAHELAHAWLRHPRGLSHAEMEEEARVQARDWGFPE